MIAGASKDDVLFRSQLSVIEQSVRDCAVRIRLPFAPGGAGGTRTMAEVVGIVVESVWRLWHGMVFVSS